MPDAPLSVGDVHDRAPELAGREITVRGRFVATLDDAWLVEDGGLGRRLRVGGADLVMACIGEIPVRVGGPHAYDDPGEVTGVVGATAGGLTLQPVRAVAVFRGGTTYRADLGGR